MLPPWPATAFLREPWQSRPFPLSLRGSRAQRGNRGNLAPSRCHCEVPEHSEGTVATSPLPVVIARFPSTAREPWQSRPFPLSLRGSRAPRGNRGNLAPSRCHCEVPEQSEGTVAISPLPDVIASFPSIAREPWQSRPFPLSLRGSRASRGNRGNLAPSRCHCEVPEHREGTVAISPELTGWLRRPVPRQRDPLLAMTREWRRRCLSRATPPRPASLWSGPSGHAHPCLIWLEMNTRAP